MQLGAVFKLFASVAKEIDAASAAVSAERIKAAAPPATPPKATGSTPPPPAAAEKPGEPAWQRELKARLPKTPPRPNQGVEQRERDSLLTHIKAYSKLGPDAAAAMLTTRGAQKRLAAEGISARQSVPALQLGLLKKGGIGQVCTCCALPLCWTLCLACVLHLVLVCVLYRTRVLPREVFDGVVIVSLRGP